MTESMTESSPEPATVPAGLDIRHVLGRHGDLHFYVSVRDKVVVDSVMDSVTNVGSALTCVDSGPERP